MNTKVIELDGGTYQFDFICKINTIGIVKDRHYVMLLYLYEDKVELAVSDSSYLKYITFLRRG